MSTAHKKPSYWTATHAKGPEVWKWLQDTGLVGENSHGQVPEALRIWLARRSVDSHIEFYELDRCMIRLGYHPSVLPEEAWVISSGHTNGDNVRCLTRRRTQGRHKPKVAA